MTLPDKNYLDIRAKLFGTDSKEFLQFANRRGLNKQEAIRYLIRSHPEIRNQKTDKPFLTK